MREKRFVRVALVLAAVFFFVGTAAAAEFKYVGSKKSDKYHHPSCTWAKKIKPENLKIFKTAKEALDAGYVPCKVCKPPTKD
ncbi:MAG: Ada metal-binding domain-containing protein [candidate division WOR-3 bacterium]